MNYKQWAVIQVFAPGRVDVVAVTETPESAAEVIADMWRSCLEHQTPTEELAGLQVRPVIRSVGRS